MESLCSKQVLVIYTTTTTTTTTTHELSVNLFSKRRRKQELVKNPIHSSNKRFQPFQSKKSDFQDFSAFAKPLQLLPAQKVLSVCSETSLQDVSSLFDDIGGSESLFKLKLHTSNFYRSGLTSVSTGILVCIIDQNGNSILQRIPASMTANYSAEFDDTAQPDVLHFQRGSVDEFTFKGPKVESIEAVWIGLESGQWRFRGMSLTVIGIRQPSQGSRFEYFGYQYEFDADDILLGEESQSMVELRPIQVTKLYSSSDPFTLLTNSLPQSVPSFDTAISNEESMKDYADLKFSLLLYDAILVFLGTTITSVTAGESFGFAFLIGGITGFLYLWLVQRSVDELAGPESISEKAPMSFNLKGPIVSLALGFVVSLAVAKYRLGDGSLVLSSKDLVGGMLGFLASKVAVVLGAFKPIPIGLNSKEEQISK
ncbi:hypothetical protein ACFE04_004757 [Oxalis oulophora]